jgi:hypothetical protein
MKGDGATRLTHSSWEITRCDDPECGDHGECLTMGGAPRRECWCHNCLQTRFLGTRS